jgi:hypothetical protein
MSNTGTTDEVSFWMNAAGSKRILTKEEVLIVARRIQSEPKGSVLYKKSVNKLVSHNLRLVIRSVHLFMNSKSRRNWGSVDTIDFLQVGALGLVRAAEKYDPTMGYTFATYATYWIRSFINRYGIKTSSVFHVPENACRDAYSFEKHGHIRGKSQEEGWMLTSMVRAAQSSVSLDTPITKDGDLFLIDLIESTYGEQFEHGRFSEEMEDLMKKAKLTEPQIKVLEYMFIDELKVKDIIKITDMSRVQVCNLKKVALAKLKNVISTV